MQWGSAAAPLDLGMGSATSVPPTDFGTEPSHSAIDHGFSEALECAENVKRGNVLTDAPIEFLPFDGPGHEARPGPAENPVVGS
jgi:hypothetical protein